MQLSLPPKTLHFVTPLSTICCPKRRSIALWVSASSEPSCSSHPSTSERSLRSGEDTATTPPVAKNNKSPNSAATATRGFHAPISTVGRWGEWRGILPFYPQKLGLVRDRMLTLF